MGLKCGICNKELDKRPKTNCFVLNDYYQITDIVCFNCFYEKVAHDASGKPIHPVAYRNALKKYKAGRVE